MAAWWHLHGRRFTRTVALVTLAASGVLAWQLTDLVPDRAWWAVALDVLLLGSAASVVGWWIPRLRVRRARAAGALTDEQVRIRFDDAGMHIERSDPSRGWRSRIVWSAVERIVPRNRHIYLHMSDVQAVSVPRRAIGDRAAQAAFVAQVRGWQAADTDDVVPEHPEPGRDERVLHYRLVTDDYVLFSRVAQAEQLRRRPAALATMGVLTAAVLLVSAEPWRAGLDSRVLSLMVLFSVALVAIGLAPLWYPRWFIPWGVRRTLRRSPGRMPSGPVVLGVGPDGGWLRSNRGVSRFGWTELSRVHSDADLVLLMFGDQVGVIVPGRAFRPATEQDAFVADVERWQAAIRPPAPSAPVRSRPPVGIANPFEPPSS